MTSPDSAPIASQAVPFEKPGVPHAATPTWAWLSLVVGATGLGCSLMLWQKVDGMQEQLARQTADLRSRGAQGWALYRYDSLFGPARNDLAAAECAALTAQNGETR